jgi:CRP/FNR family transcriptional regulator
MQAVEFAAVSPSAVAPVGARRRVALPDAESAASGIAPAAEAPGDESRRIAAMLELVADAVALQRRVVHAGDVVYRAGQPFTHLYVLNAGLFKAVTLAPDGREQVAALQFRGDWLGFDGIADARHRCDAVAMDTGEVWALPYDALLAACTRRPELLALLHAEMSRAIGRDRDAMLSLCTLSADERVAEFLQQWAGALARRGLRTDQITLRMTRAEIGSYLGMTLESVSRALSRLAQRGLIRFVQKGRREISIPSLDALRTAFGCDPRPAGATVQ